MKTRSRIALTAALVAVAWGVAFPTYAGEPSWTKSAQAVLEAKTSTMHAGALQIDQKTLPQKMAVKTDYTGDAKIQGTVMYGGERVNAIGMQMAAIGGGNEQAEAATQSYSVIESAPTPVVADQQFATAAEQGKRFNL